MNPFFEAFQVLPPEATESSRPWRLPPHALSLEDSRRRQGLCTPDDSYHDYYYNSALISKLSWWPLTLITPPPFSALSVANPARHCERFIYKDWQYKGHICNIWEQNFPHLLQIIKLIHTSSCVDVLVKLRWVPAHMCHCHHDDNSKYTIRGVRILFVSVSPIFFCSKCDKNDKCTWSHSMWNIFLFEEQPRSIRRWSGHQFKIQPYWTGWWFG